MDFWTGALADIPAGRPVIVGFPQDEGVRRNGGRVGAAQAPDESRRWLYRLVAYDASRQADLAALGTIDVGNVAVSDDLEASQVALGEVVGELLLRGSVPIVLGGGHETAYGVYLGHVRAKRPVAVLNLDAHLDVRPTIAGKGHSGSPFRQMMEHTECPLPGSHYTCVGAQPFSVSREHAEFVTRNGGAIHWADDELSLGPRLLDTPGVDLHLSLDADVVRAADVPGVSAPNPVGLSGSQVARFIGLAGEHFRSGSVEVVEINPRFDPDGRSARWAAVAVWHFLRGLALRPPRR